MKPLIILNENMELNTYSSEKAGKLHIQEGESYRLGKDTYITAYGIKIFNGFDSDSHFIAEITPLENDDKILKQVFVGKCQNVVYSVDFIKHTDVPTEAYFHSYRDKEINLDTLNHLDFNFLSSCVNSFRIEKIYPINSETLFMLESNFVDVKYSSFFLNRSDIKQFLVHFITNTLERHENEKYKESVMLSIFEDIIKRNTPDDLDDILGFILNKYKNVINDNIKLESIVLLDKNLITKLEHLGIEINLEKLPLSFIRHRLSESVSVDNLKFLISKGLNPMLLWSKYLSKNPDPQIEKFVFKLLKDNNTPLNYWNEIQKNQYEALTPFGLYVLYGDEDQKFDVEFNSNSILKGASLKESIEFCKDHWTKFLQDDDTYKTLCGPKLINNDWVF